MRKRPIKFIVGELGNKFYLKCCIFGFTPKENSIEIFRSGSSYGGWWWPRAEGIFLQRTLVSVGLGLDVSMDLDMMRRGFRIIGIDPIEASIQNARRALTGNGDFELHCLALSLKSGFLKLYPPLNKSNFSWSFSAESGSHNLQDGVKFPSISLADLVGRLNLDSTSGVNFLKMDIESAEKEILLDASFNAKVWDAIGVELDFLSQPRFRSVFLRTKNWFICRKILQRMLESGFMLIHIESYNLLWIRSSSTKKFKST